MLDHFEPSVDQHEPHVTLSIDVTHFEGINGEITSGSGSSPSDIPFIDDAVESLEIVYRLEAGKHLDVQFGSLRHDCILDLCNEILQKTNSIKIKEKQNKKSNVCILEFYTYC